MFAHQPSWRDQEKVYWEVLSCGAAFHAIYCDSKNINETLRFVPLRMKATEQYSTVLFLFIMFSRPVWFWLTCETIDEIVAVLLYNSYQMETIWATKFPCRITSLIIMLFLPAALFKIKV